MTTSQDLGNAIDATIALQQQQTQDQQIYRPQLVDAIDEGLQTQEDDSVPERVIDMRVEFKKALNSAKNRKMDMMMRNHVSDTEEEFSARASLDNLLHYRWDNETLQKFELKKRYQVCKYNETEALKSSNDYFGVSCFFLESNNSRFLQKGDRACVVYENKNNPNHQKSLIHSPASRERSEDLEQENTDELQANPNTPSSLLNSPETIQEVKESNIAKDFADKHAEPNTAKWYRFYYSTLLAKPIEINRILRYMKANGWNETKILYSEKDISEFYEK